MSDPSKKKSAPKNKAANNEEPPAPMAAVQDIVALACRLGEVAAMVRAASTEFIIRFHGDDVHLPELLLQRPGSGARPATVEAILEAESALEELARDLDARARALLKLPVDVGEVADRPQTVIGVGVDQVVHRDLLESALRLAAEKRS